MQIDGVDPNQPFYLYQMPMFSVTVSTVLIVENGVVMVRNDYEDKESDWSFPGGRIRAALESMQFAALRYVKMVSGVTLKKELFIPVDFRSEPERSKIGNEIDVGFALITEGLLPETFNDRECVKWFEVDFENKCLIDDDVNFYMDHEILLQRALEVMLLVKID